MINMLKPKILSYDIMDKYLNSNLRSSDRTVLTLWLKGWGILHINVGGKANWRSNRFFISPGTNHCNYIIPVGVKLNIVFMNVFGSSTERIKINEAGIEPPSIPSAPNYKNIVSPPARVSTIKITNFTAPPAVKMRIFTNKFRRMHLKSLEADPNLNLPRFSIPRNEYGKWKTHILQLDVVEEMRTFISKFKRSANK